MGTGSRKRSIKKSRYEAYREGDGRAQDLTWDQAFASYEGQPGYSPPAEMAARMRASTALGTRGVPIGTGHGAVSAGYDPTSREYTPPNTDPMLVFSQKYKDWLERDKANEAAHKTGITPDREMTWQEQFEQMYGDPTADIRSAYAGQEAAINKQYDTMLGRLGSEHGAAERGVRAEGQQLQSALTAIGADATAQLAASNRQIDQDYSKALQAVNNDYKPLANDLAASGAGGAGLKAEAAAGRADLREAQQTDSALGQRYSQMLSQEINNRQATGATVTTANVQDLARILQQSRDNASADRLGAVAKLEASLAGDLAQAKSQKNAAKYSLWLDVIKSGGTLGDAATKTASAGTHLSAARDAAKNVLDYRDVFKPLSKSENSDEREKGNKILVALTNKEITPEEAWSAWTLDKNKGDMPTLGGILSEAVAYNTVYNNKKKVLAAGREDALAAPR